MSVVTACAAGTDTQKCVGRGRSPYWRLMSGPITQITGEDDTVVLCWRGSEEANNDRSLFLEAFFGGWWNFFGLVNSLIQANQFGK